MRHAVLLLLAAAAFAQAPEGRRPIIPPGDPFPWCGTGRVWTGPLRVRVVGGKGGRPVAGIEVALASGAACATDAKGIARFERADSSDTLRIRAIGYRPFEKGVPEDDEELLVVLRPGIPVRGRVLLADGAPARDARAACWDEYGLRLLDGVQDVDGHGRFVIAAVEKGEPFSLVVSLPGFAPVVVRKALVREEPELSLTLGGRGGIEGVVTPPSDIVYVRVAPGRNPLRLDRGDEMQRESIGMETAFAHPDETGRYRIEGLPVPGAYVVCAGPNESAVVQLSEAHPLATVDLSSAAGPARSIRILDEDGNPLKREWICLVGPTGIENAETSEDGVVDLPPGDWGVDVYGFLPAPAAPVVKLDRGVTVRGVATYPDGSPASDVAVSLCQPFPAGGYRAHTATTDAQGRFSISGHVEGDGWITAGREPEGPHGPDDGRIRIRRGMGEVRLEIPVPSPAPASRAGEAKLRGVVVDASGRPVAGARVDPGYPHDATSTDEKGAFSVTVHPLAPLVLEVGAPGFAPRYVPVEKPDGGPVKVVLDPGGLVRGRVVDRGGKAVPGAYIVFWRRLASGRLSPVEDWKPDTDSAGRFEIRLPPGTYHARFYDMAFSHARIPGPDVTVRGGETIDLEIRLP